MLLVFRIEMSGCGLRVGRDRCLLSHEGALALLQESTDSLLKGLVLVGESLIVGFSHFLNADLKHLPHHVHVFRGH